MRYVCMYVCCGFAHLLVVGCVHENLVKDLVETRDKVNLPLDNCFRSIVPDPHGLGETLDGADVGVRPEQNVLELSETLGKQA
jgi:hypothetical protein